MTRSLSTHRPNRSVPTLQSLEARKLLATNLWTGGADGVNWSNNGNWSLGRAPIDGDDVIIDTFNPASVRVVGDTALLNSLTNRETITLFGNIFTISTSILVNGGSLVNEGTIILSSGGNVGHQSSLSPFGDAVIHNKPSGVIRTEPGSGGTRTVGGPLGTFLNEGTMIANVETQVVGPYHNVGSVQVNTGRLWLTQAQTTFAPGTSVIGRVDGLAGSIHITATSASFVINTESEVDFLGNLSPGVTINVQGNQFARGATLNVPNAGTINKGTIQLSSYDGTWPSSLLGAGGLVNDGVLRTLAGTGGGRTIDLEGPVDGLGDLELSQPFTFFRAARIRQDVVIGNASQILLLDDPTDAGTSKANFQLDTNTRFLINRNAVIFDYDGASALGSVEALLRAGYNGGFWNDPAGIGSDFIDRGAGDSIGYSEATDAGVAGRVFAGVPIDSTAVLVRQTKVGDVNLDRAVNFDDLLVVAQNYEAPAGQRWSTGDFFYDGSVDFNDLLALAQQYGYNGAQAAPAQPAVEPTPKRKGR